MRNLVLAILLLALLAPAAAHAACTAPAGNAGDMIYNGDAHIPQYCNGVSWVVMAPTVNLPPTNGLVGYWKLDDGSGTSAIDSSGNGDTGTLTNSPVWSAGYYNSALTFTAASSQYVHVPYASALEPATAFTVTAWVKPTSTAQMAIIASPDNNGYTAGWRLAVDATPNLNGVVTTSNVTTAVTLAAHPLAGQWTHVALVYNGSTLTAYSNGVAGTPTAVTGTVTYGSNQYLPIGHASGVPYFDGVIDDVRVYNRALSAAEISTIYNYHISPPSSGLAARWKLDESGGTTAADSSGNGNTGTIVNGPVFTSAGKLAGALTFDGATQYVDIAGNPASLQITGSLTLTSWVNVASITGATQTILAKNNQATNNRSYALNLDPANCGGNENFNMTISPDGTAFEVRCSNTVAVAGTWYFVADVYDASAQTMNIYVNGLLDNRSLIGTVPASLYNSTADVNIGRKASNNNYFDGTIDDPRIYSRALSADEIYGLYRTSSPVCSSPSGYEGDVMYNAGTTSHVLQFCDSASWRPLGPVPGMGGAGCTSPAGAEGDTIYNDSAAGSGVLQYCDGTKWIKLGGPNLPTSGLAGYWKLDDGAGTSAADSSGNGNTGTTHNAPTWATGHDSGALAFVKASSQYVTIPDAASLELAGSWTVSTWVKPTTVPGSGGGVKVLSKDDASNNSNYGIAIVNGINGCASLSWRIYFDTAGGLHSPACYLTTINPGTWYHVVGEWDSVAKNLMIYLNGVLVVTQNVPSNVPTSASGNPLELANEAGSAAYLDGTLDDVRVYNRALSAQEIWQLYAGTQ